MAIKDLHPLPNTILGRVLFGEQTTAGGIVLRDDNGKDHGIRPRWAKIWKVGDNVTDVKPGDWVLVEHGRWSFVSKIDLEGKGKEFEFHRIDPNCIMMIAEDGKPADIMEDITDF